MLSSIDEDAFQRLVGKNLEIEVEAMQSETSRNNNYEFIRVLLTILVVFGHSAYYNIETSFGGIHYATLMNVYGISDTLFHRILTYVTNWIYTFHMPAFFMLSGMINIRGQSRHKDETVLETIKRKAKRLLVPLVIVWFVWNAPIKYLSGYYSGSNYGSIILQVFFPSKVYLWYLEALFIIFVIDRLLSSCKVFVKCGISLLFWITGMLSLHYLRGWVPFGNPFRYFIWFVLGEHYDVIFPWLKNLGHRNRILLAFFLFAIHIVVFVYIEATHASKTILSNSILPLIGCVLLLILSDNCSDRALWIGSRYGQYSFGIYLWAEPLNYLFYLVLHLYGE